MQVKLTKNQKKIYNYLKANPYSTRKQVRTAIYGNVTTQILQVFYAMQRAGIKFDTKYSGGRGGELLFSIHEDYEVLDSAGSGSWKRNKKELDK